MPTSGVVPLDLMLCPGGYLLAARVGLCPLRPGTCQDRAGGAPVAISPNSVPEAAARMPGRLSKLSISVAPHLLLGEGCTAQRTASSGASDSFAGQWHGNRGSRPPDQARSKRAGPGPRGVGKITACCCETGDSFIMMEAKAVRACSAPSVEMVPKWARVCLERNHGSEGRPDGPGRETTNSQRVLPIVSRISYRKGYRA